jgi:methylmalonyl-CoA mutase
MDDLSLAAEFPAPSREQWLKLVEGVLKGAAFEKKLVSRSYDGIALQPLYEKAENAAPVTRAEPGRWRISQRVDHPDPQIANELALADLAGGADALTLVFAKTPASRGFGLGIDTLDDLDRALSGVMLDLVHVRLDAGGYGRQAAAMLVALAERRGHKLADLQIDFALDPVGAMAAMGKLSASWDIVAVRCADTLAGLHERGFAGRAFLADGRPYHEAGAGEAQELAAVLATGVAYLRALEAGGHDLERARDSLAFLLVADADEFLTIAKFRALRRLWARIEAACGLAPKPLRLHAETAWRMTTRRDPWVNLLRTTVAAFSAGVGGADAITVLPFTAALGLPDAFARRLARNTQHILLEESNLWRVLDPAAGSGTFEGLTDALAEKAWRAFQEIETEGGIVDSLRAGAVQARIAETRAARERAVATKGSAHRHERVPEPRRRAGSRADALPFRRAIQRRSGSRIATHRARGAALWGTRRERCEWSHPRHIGRNRSGRGSRCHRPPSSGATRGAVRGLAGSVGRLLGPDRQPAQSSAREYRPSSGIQRPFNVREELLRGRWSRNGRSTSTRDNKLPH